MSELFCLECDHCGSAAIAKDVNLFTDGECDVCESCGMPGSVSCDSESEPYWATSDSPDDRCADPECDECAEAL